MNTKQKHTEKAQNEPKQKEYWLEIPGARWMLTFCALQQKHTEKAQNEPKQANPGAGKPREK
jgi:hypothetical protein